MNETTIPILPCPAIDPVLDFYQALGFEVTYRQKRPNTYAVVRRDGIELQFFVLKGLDPAQSYSTCYVLAPDVDTLYGAFTDGLRRSLGRLPTRGVPRIGALKDMSYGVRQFVMVDPAGNTIRVGRPLAAGAPAEPPGTRLEKAVETAALLGDSKGDHRAAARVLDHAFAAQEAEPAVPRVRALILRADLAVRLGERDLARRLLADARRVRLGTADLAALADDLRRADDLDDDLRE